MKKVAAWIVLSLSVLVITALIFVKISPPFTGYLASYSHNRHLAIIEVGNVYPIGEIEIVKVQVDGVVPKDVKVQVSHSQKGYILTHSTAVAEEEGYTMKAINEVTLKPNTDPRKQLEKANKGISTPDDETYGLTLFHDEPMTKFYITYKFLGMTFKETIE